MLKKSLFIVAIALLSVGAYARDYVTPEGSTVDIAIQCNVNIQLSVSWSKASGIDLGGYGHSESVSPSTLDAPGGTVTISLTLKDVNLANLTGGTNCLQVGTVTLRVRPNLKPQLAGA